MAFRASVCASTHNGNIEFLERNDQFSMAVLVGWVPSKATSIQHFFHFGFFHFAPTTSSPLKRNGPPTHAKPPTSNRAVLAITKMSIVFLVSLRRKSLIHLKNELKTRLLGFGELTRP
jgi:hypothetical protein